MSHLRAAGDPFDQFLAGLASDVPGPRSDAPPWFTQVATALFDGQDPAVSKEWARRLYEHVERLGGNVPFRVVHDWHAHVVGPMLAEASERCGTDPGVQHALQRLHARALAGDPVTEAEWQATLGPAFQQVYRHAYAYAEAFATAHTNAYAYAIANGFDEPSAVKYGEDYAKLSTPANQRSYADANALANAKAVAAAYAAGNSEAYAEAYPSAYVYVYAHAWANQGAAAAAAGTNERREEAYRRLADGWIDTMGRTAGSR